LRQTLEPLEVQMNLKEEKQAVGEFKPSSAAVFHKRDGRVHMYVRACMCARASICECARVYVCMCLRTWVRVCVAYVYAFVCVCVCVCVCARDQTRYSSPTNEYTSNSLAWRIIFDWKRV